MIRWPKCTGTGGRNKAEWVAAMERNEWPESSGISMYLIYGYVEIFSIYIVRYHGKYFRLLTLLDANAITEGMQNDD